MGALEPQPESESPQGPRKLLLLPPSQKPQQTHGSSASALVCAYADPALQGLLSSLLMAHSGHLMTFLSVQLLWLFNLT